jgi:hypothetical protein
VKSNLLCLVLLLGLVALVSYRRRPEQILSVRLLLTRQPMSLVEDKPLVRGDCFRLALHLLPNGSAQMSSSQRVNSQEKQGLLRTLSPIEWSRLERGLAALSGWRTPQCNSDQPEGQVLYTLMEVETSQGQFRSYWRGLPKPQAEVANYLLQSALGSTLRQGLEQLQSSR